MFLQKFQKNYLQMYKAIAYDKMRIAVLALDKQDRDVKYAALKEEVQDKFAEKYPEMLRLLMKQCISLKRK